MSGPYFVEGHKQKSSLQDEDTVTFDRRGYETLEEATAKAKEFFENEQDLSLAVSQGKVHALIGPNGAGKTTVLNCISRFYDADAGSIRFLGHEMTRLAEREGLLPDNHLFEVWHEHQFKEEPRYTPDLYPFFLRLMEKYDVSYRLPEGDASLVAQHVPQVRPNLPWLPEEEPKDNQRRLGMVCVMDDAPPGLVPWMIVRTHDYAYPVGQHSLHWQKGMFLRNTRHGEAMLELRGREFHMYAEAIWPKYFMNILRQRLVNSSPITGLVSKDAIPSQCLARTMNARVALKLQPYGSF